MIYPLTSPILFKEHRLFTIFMLGIEKEGLIKVDDSHTPVNYIVMPLCRKGLSVSSKRVYLF